MKSYLSLLLAIVLIFLAACDPQTLEQQSSSKVTPRTTSVAASTEAKATPTQSKNIIMGETIYVPIYSDIYYAERSKLDLFATLSIRNTDLAKPILITSVRYYNGEGKLVKQYLNCPQQLSPLASREFLAPTTQGGESIGTNYIVEWAAESKVTSPIVEAVMLSTVSTQGISFTSVGRVIQNQGATSIKVCP